MSQKLPYVAQNEYGVPTLYVKEKPFIIIGGELFNSSFSSLEFMEKEVWPYLQRSYEVLSGMMPEIIKRRGSDKMKAFIRSNLNEKGMMIPMDGYDIQLDYVNGTTGSAGIVLVEDQGFYIAGCNVKFKLWPKKGSRQYLTVLRLEEGEFADGIWKRGRILNGDELAWMKLGDMAEVKYVKVCVQDMQVLN